MKGVILSKYRPVISPSEIADVLEENLARYSGKTGLLSGSTRKLMLGERRRVAVLFLDLTGFTSLSEFLDHEVLHNLINRLLGFLSSVVESFGGYVDKFEGDRIMALFGAKSSADNDSARAVACALRMQDIIDEVSGSNNIAARVGINFGSVTVAPDPSGHLTATGITVNLASRIEEMAVPGTILVTEKVKRECGGLFRFQRHGKFDIRGISLPVELFIPLGPGIVQHERWQRAGRLSDSPMVNRVKEREILNSALQKAFSGKKKSILVRIAGEAGIGKSRLLHEFLQKVSNVQILHGHTKPYAQPPFCVWINLFTKYLNIRNETSGEISEKIEKIAGECADKALGRKLKSVSSVVADLLSLTETGSADDSFETSRTRIAAFKLMLDTISRTGPMILALEDLHWIDEPSTKVLRLFLESERNFNPVMVVTTERPSEKAPRIRNDNCIVLNLQPLSRDEIFEISGHILSDEYKDISFDRDLENLITRGAKGNPFYAEELVLGLIESGGLVSRENNQWGLCLQADQVDIPSSVQSIIQARIDKLPGNERKVLQLASVTGSDLRIPVLESLVSRLEFGINTAEILDALISKGFLATTDNNSISFRHDLIRISVYSTLLKHNRRIIHRYTAEALENIYPDEASALAPILFGHWKLTGDEEKTLEWALKALVSAKTNDQKSEILSLSETILDLASDPSGRDREKWLASTKALLAKQGILATAGNLTEALEIVDQILKDIDRWDSPSVKGEALRQKCILLSDMGKMDELDNLFRLALETAGEAEDEKLKGSIYSILANYLSNTGKTAEAYEYYKEALAIHIKHDNKKLIAATYSNIGNLLSKTGDSTGAEYNCRRSIEISRELGNRSTLAYALNSYAVIRAIKGDLKQARELFEEALEYHIDMDNKPLQSGILGNLGILARMMNEFERSLNCYSRSLELIRQTGNKQTETITLLNIGNLYRLMGHPEKSLKFCRESRVIAVQINNPRLKCHSLSVESMVELERGNTETALGLYDLAVKIIEEGNYKPGVIEDFDDLLSMLLSKGITRKLPSAWQSE